MPLSVDAEIPKKIHYIWVGGAIPEKYLSHIMLMQNASAKSGYELNVWVDNKANFEKSWAKSSYSTYIDRENIDIRLRDISELQDNLFDYEENPDIRSMKSKQFNTIITNESVGNKNLAAASDGLRLEILRQEGGIYLDTDLIPIIKKKEKEQKEDSPLSACLASNGFLIFAEEKNDDGTVEKINNCMLASAINHPILKICIESLLNNYKGLEAAYDSHNLKKDKYPITFFDIKRSHIISERMYIKCFGRFQATINTSGPGLIASAISEYASQHNLLDEDFVFTAKKGKGDYSVALGSIEMKVKCDNTWSTKCRIFLEEEMPEEKGTPNTYYVVKEPDQPWKVIYRNENQKLKDISSDFAAILPSKNTSMSSNSYFRIRDDFRYYIGSYHVKKLYKHSYDDEGTAFRGESFPSHKKGR